METGREQVARFFGASTEHIIFTSSGSEGNNMVLKSVLTEKLLSNSPAHIITSEVEHSSVRLTCEWLSRFGIEVTFVGVDKTGRVRPADVKAAIRPETRLISIQYANNEVGTLQPISEIAQIAKEAKIRVHSDAVQAAGKLPLNFLESGLDAITVSGHKLYAPKGIGAVLVKDAKEWHSLITGASHERKLRAGTESVPLIATLGHVLSLHTEYPDYTDLRNSLISTLQSALPDIVIHTPLDNALSNTLCFGFSDIEGHGLAINCDLDGFSVSTGSACSVGSIEPSPILAAMGVSDILNTGSIRVSLGTSTTEASLSRFAESVIDSVKRMKGLS
jgi:cysteine desulfurase